jgi:hypothetical protein
MDARGLKIILHLGPLLAARRASEIPLELTITGKNRIVCHDVLIGHA